MQQFFSKILKQKKLLSFALLFFVLIGIVVPCVAYGGIWNSIGDIIGMMPGIGGAINTGISLGSLNNSLGGPDIGGKMAKAIADVTVTPVFSAMLLVVAFFLITIFGSISNLAGGLLLFIIGLASNPVTPAWSYTHFTNPIIAIGWTQVRDLANMVVVLGFVIVGIATALRFQDYEAKKLLPKLIIAALLINFSLLICGIFIDGSNILTSHFLKTGGFLEQSVGQAIGEQMNNVYDHVGWTNTSQLPDLIGGIVAIIFFDIITTIIFFLYFFLFLFRYVMLWILVVLSPLAFVFYVFPFTKKFFDMWWNNFLQWCIIGVAGSFFLYLANALTNGLTNGASPSNVGMVNYLIPSAFLIGGLLISMKSSAMGASMAVSAFKKTGKGLGKAGMELTGRSKMAQGVRENLRSAGSRIAEVTGFAPEGHAALQKTSREAIARKQVDALRTSSSAGDKSRFKQLVETGKGAMGAAAVASANEHGDLAKYLNPDNDAKGLNKMNERVSYAKAFGHESSEFEKKNYQLKQFNENAVNDSLKARGLNPATISALDTRRIQAQRDVMMTQLADIMPQMSIGELGRVNSTHIGIANHEFTKENITPHIIEKIGVTPNRALIAGMIADRGNFASDLSIAQTNNDKAEANRLQKIINAIDRLPGATPTPPVIPTP